jgi:hypothetical protein
MLLLCFIENKIQNKYQTELDRKTFLYLCETQARSFKEGSLTYKNIEYKNNHKD